MCVCVCVCVCMCVCVCVCVSIALNDACIKSSEKDILFDHISSEDADKKQSTKINMES